MPDDDRDPLEGIEQMVEEKRAEGRAPQVPTTEQLQQFVDAGKVDDDPPFCDISEVAKGWGFNARESAAWALGWRQAITYGAAGVDHGVVPLVRIRCHRDQAGALLAALVEAGANVTGHGSYREHRTYNVAV